MKYFISLIFMFICFSVSSAVEITTPDEFKAWIKKPENHGQVYFIPKNTIMSLNDETRDRYIEVFNTIYSNGGQFNIKQVQQAGGVRVLSGWSLGRITTTVDGINVVLVQLLKPPTMDILLECWVHIGQIQLYDEFKAQRAY